MKLNKLILSTAMITFFASSAMAGKSQYEIFGAFEGITGQENNVIIESQSIEAFDQGGLNEKRFISNQKTIANLKSENNTLKSSITEAYENIEGIDEDINDFSGDIDTGSQNEFAFNSVNEGLILIKKGQIEIVERLQAKIANNLALIVALESNIDVEGNILIAEQVVSEEIAY